MKIVLNDLIEWLIISNMNIVPTMWEALLKSLQMLAYITSTPLGR